MKQAICIALVATAGTLAVGGLVSERHRAGVPGDPGRALAASLLPGEAAGGDLAAERAALGERLFHETLLSRDGTISCASCHDLARGGADGRRVSIGVGGAAGERNAPTVFHVARNLAQFWDGRAQTLEQQIDGPLLSPVEMGSTWPDVLRKLREHAGYAREFERLYAEGVAEHTVKDAIATFERTLGARDSRYDRFLAGEQGALSSEERRGYELFLEVGCTACHEGANLGGNSYQRFGVTSNWFEDRGSVAPSDLGRFNVTGEERDKFKFKVPTLRDVSRTAPYFHDGSVATLEEAISIMGRYQIGQALSDAEVARIAAFLRTLEGRSPQARGPAGREARGAAAEDRAAGGRPR